MSGDVSTVFTNSNLSGQTLLHSWYICSPSSFHYSANYFNSIVACGYSYNVEWLNNNVGLRFSFSFFNLHKNMTQWTISDHCLFSWWKFKFTWTEIVPVLN